MSDVLSASKEQQHNDDERFKCLNLSVDARAERAKHILIALQAASVPFDNLTAGCLEEMGDALMVLIEIAVAHGEGHE